MLIWDISLKEHVNKDPKEIKIGLRWLKLFLKNGKNLLEQKNNIIKKCMNLEWNKEVNY